MSLLGKYLQGWRFRGSRPSLEPGSEVNVFITEYDDTEGTAIARIGDSRLYVDGAGRELLEKRVRVSVSEFDEAAGVGRGEFVRVIGESSYTG